jgi:hypothetical protein
MLRFGPETQHGPNSAQADAICGVDFSIHDLPPTMPMGTRGKSTRLRAVWRAGTFAP